MKQDVRSICWLLVGSTLLLVAMTVLAVNERNVLAYRTVADRHGGIVVDATHSGPTSGNDGDRVLVVGTPRIIKPAVDRQFGVRADAPVLWRSIAMFQWREVDYGGSTNYELQWVSHPVDSSIFKQPKHHHNPSQMPFGGAHYLAGEVYLSGFVLSPMIVEAITGRESFEPDLEFLRPNMAASFHVVSDDLLVSGDPSSPQLGDLRVSWQRTPSQPVTLIARNRGGTLVAADDNQGHPDFELQVGRLRVVDLYSDLPPQPLLPWIWRMLSLLLAGAGAYVLVRDMSSRRTVFVAVTGIAVSLVCGLVSVMWMATRPSVGGVLAVIAVLALGFTAWRMHGDTVPR